MAQNKNALIRYRVIDRCLQNYFRSWTLDDLIAACSAALYEYEGRKIEVSKRTIQLDIQMMRSDKLGYNAPIIVYDKKFYKYENKAYKLSDLPVSENDINILSEAVEILKQFKDFTLFSEIGSIINKLEDKIYTEKTLQPAIIHFDKNENLKGLEHLDPLYKAILTKKVLKIYYQSFTARNSNQITIHPIILKEFNNRWFLVGKNHNSNKIMTLALDRIKNIEVDLNMEYSMKYFDAEEYYKNTYGVTVLGSEYVHSIELKFDKINAPYILTKPIHQSQQLIEKYQDGSILIGLKLHLNYELERLLLGYGESLEIIKPNILKRKIKNKLQKALQNYSK